MARLFYPSTRRLVVGPVQRISWHRAGGTGKAPGLPCTITRVKKQDFYELVERALEELPPELAELLDNVAIVVEDWPDYSTPLWVARRTTYSTDSTRGCP